MSVQLPSVPRLLASLRCGESGEASRAAAECLSMAQEEGPLRDALVASGVLAALAGLLSSPPSRGRACVTAARCLSFYAGSADVRLLAAHACAPLVLLLAPGCRADAAACAAAQALWQLSVDCPPCRDAALAAPECLPRLLSLLSQAEPTSEAAVCAARCLCELLAERPQAREALRDCGGFAALTSCLHCGLDSHLGGAACLALLRCAHSDGLRGCLSDAGKLSWTLINSFSSVEETHAGRLAALLLIALLFCTGREPNRAAGKLLNRLEISRHVAALLAAACEMPPGASSFPLLGTRWTPFEVCLYARVLAENEDFSGRLADLGAHSLLARMLPRCAGSTPPLLDAVVGMTHLAGRDLVSSAGRELRAVDDAVASVRSMLQSPMHNAVQAFCCAAPAQREEEEGA